MFLGKVLAMGLAFLLTGCGNVQTENTPKETTNIAVIEMENGGIIEVELYEAVAPITVANFKDLVTANFYDGLSFHRIIKGFMIQGGDPLGNGTGGSEKKIKGEFTANGVDNSLKHERGVISMARSADMDSASCQFFIVHEDAPHLDGQYAAFGKVVSGMDVVDQLADTAVGPDGQTPTEKPVIKSITMK